jgi:serine/threonine-protein kinase HipA
MRKAKVLFKDQEAGELIQHDDGSFTFNYYEAWLVDSAKPSISLTLPKQHSSFSAKFLFPFFFNMLPEGSNKQAVCMQHRLDLDDYFGILTTSAQYDSIGAVRVLKMEQ